MKNFVLKWLTISFSVVLISSFVSMMASFVGAQGDDLRDLLLLQIALVPIAIIAMFWCLGGFVRQFGYSKALPVFWKHLPGWLLFTVISANSLVLIAELSFVLLQYHNGHPLPWRVHVPAATALTSSLALAFCYVSFHLAKDG